MVQGKRATACAAAAGLLAVISSTDAFTFTQGAMPLRTPAAAAAAAAPHRHISGRARGCARMSTVERPAVSEVTFAPVGDVKPADIGSLSYSEQYDEIFSKPLVVNKPIAKPVPELQQLQPGAKKVFLSDVYGVLKRNRFINRPYGPQVSLLLYNAAIEVFASQQLVQLLCHLCLRHLSLLQI
jgi:hypothetical protein